MNISSNNGLIIIQSNHIDVYKIIINNKTKTFEVIFNINKKTNGKKKFLFNNKDYEECAIKFCEITDKLVDNGYILKRIQTI